MLFQSAERLQAEHQSGYPRLYSLQGFRYCDLLLALAGADTQGIGEVVERAEYDLDCWENHFTNGSILSFSLPKLTLARAHLQPALHPSTAGRGRGAEGKHITQATDWLEKAVAGLRAASNQQFLPLGLLTRATLHRLTRNFPKAQQDLQEVLDIAEPGGMRLHLTDYHLEAARLAHAMGEAQETIQHHLQAAAELIQQTGYHRRDGELAALQASLL